MLAAPVRSLPELLIGDRFERKRVIVGATTRNAVFCLLFSLVSSAVTNSVLLALGANSIFTGYHEQQELSRSVSGRAPRGRK